jgi:hypothetical protein
MSEIIVARDLITDALKLGEMDRATRMRLHRAPELMVREPRGTSTRCEQPRCAWRLR